MLAAAVRAMRTTAGAGIAVLAVLALGTVGGTGVAAEPPAASAALYTGQVDARVYAGNGEPDAERGTASARFVPTAGGRARLEVSASIRRAHDSGFVVEGAPAADGWQGRGGPLRFELDANGRIHGGGIENGHRISFGGTADAERMHLVVETRRLAPPGTRIVFDYRLRRGPAAAAVGAKPSADGPRAKGACKRRIWKMRNVTTPGGGMTMIQVPHCVD